MKHNNTIDAKEATKEKIVWLEKSINRRNYSVSALLKVGKANAISSEELMRTLSINRRTLFSVVHSERLNGAVILPDNAGGYYIPDMDTEEGKREFEVWACRMKALGRGHFAVTGRKTNGRA